MIHLSHIRIQFAKKRPHFWGHNFERGDWQEFQGWKKKMPLLLKERLRSGRESGKKRVEIIGFTASLLNYEIALAPPKSIGTPEVSAMGVSHWK